MDDAASARPRRSLRGIPVILLLVFALTPPLAAGAETVAELDRAHAELVAVESDILDLQDQVRRNIEDPQMVLLPAGGGAVVGYPRAEIEAALDKLILRARLLGLDEIYLSTLTPTKRLLAALLTSGDMPREMILADLAKNAPGLRAAESKKLAMLEAELQQVRAQAAQVLKQRDRLRQWVETGESPDTADNARNDVCYDANIPVDYRANFWGGGYGGDQFPVVKGNIICRTRSWFQYMSGSELLAFDCADGDPDRCARRAGYAIAYTRITNADGNPQLELPEGKHITLFVTDE